MSGLVALITLLAIHLAPRASVFAQEHAASGR